MDRRPISWLDRVPFLVPVNSLHLRAGLGVSSPGLGGVGGGSRLLRLKGLKMCGECKSSGSFDFDAQKRASSLRMTLWGESNVRRSRG